MHLSCRLSTGGFKWTGETPREWSAKFRLWQFLMNLVFLSTHKFQVAFWLASFDLNFLSLIPERNPVDSSDLQWISGKHCLANASSSLIPMLVHCTEYRLCKDGHWQSKRLKQRPLLKWMLIIIFDHWIHFQSSCGLTFSGPHWLFFISLSLSISDLPLQTWSVRHSNLGSPI